MVMAPIALFAVWTGGTLFDVLVAAAAGVMAWEWGGLTRAISGTSRSPHQAIVSFVTVLLAGLAGHGTALVVFIIGLVALDRVDPQETRPRELWSTGGLVWITLPCIGLVWLRHDPVVGLRMVLWILATVWATDIAAYAVGRTVGGPRLAPRISPAKTWSGLAGGVVASAAVGVAACLAVDGRHWLAFAVIGAGLAVVEQMGDLAESYAKRRFGAKDSGSLIPGHGGLLDRLDGMLAVVIAVILLDRGLGESLLLWR
jgi:phosphatidate cytidylyltransferase